MVSLVDDECVLGDLALGDLVGAQEPNHLWCSLSNFGGRRSEANFVSASSRRCALENIVSLPLRSDEVVGMLLDKAADGLEYCLGVGMLRGSATNDDHWPLSGSKLFAKLSGQGSLQ